MTVVKQTPSNYAIWIVSCQSLLTDLSKLCIAVVIAAGALFLANLIFVSFGALWSLPQAFFSLAKQAGLDYVGLPYLRKLVRSFCDVVEFWTSSSREMCQHSCKYKQNQAAHDLVPDLLD